MLHHRNKPLSLFYLTDVFNIKFNVEGEFDILLMEDGLVCVTVPAQTTKGASVAGPLFICSKTKEEMQLFHAAYFPFNCAVMRKLFYLTVIPWWG